MFMVMLTKAQDAEGLARDLRNWRAQVHRNPAIILGSHLLKYEIAPDSRATEEYPNGPDGGAVYKFEGVKVECLCEFRHEHEVDLGCLGDDDPGGVKMVAYVVMQASESSEGMYVPIWTPIRVCWSREAAQRVIDAAPLVDSYPKDYTYDIQKVEADGLA